MARIDRVVLPWAALGLPAGAPPPKRFCVCLAHLPDMAHFMGGFVIEADTFDYDEADDDDPARTHRRAQSATAGGLFDEAVFGPLPRDPDGTVSLGERFDVHPIERPQSRLFGTYVLCEPVTSTWVKRFVPNAPPVLLGSIPVLPPAFRPTFARDGRVYSSDLTALYARVVNRSRRLARLLELSAPEIILENERRMLQQAVDGLLVDGVTKFASQPLDDEDEDEDGPTEDWLSDPDEIAERIEDGDEPLGKVMSLHQHMLLREPARFLRWLEKELEGNPRVLSATRWPEHAHDWRAWLEAACLEIVPLAEDGSVDEESLEKTREDRFVHVTHEVHGLAFGESISVLHVDSPREPHVDVYAYRHEGEIVLITGGMSRSAMASQLVEIGEPWIEIACVLPGDVDDATREAVMRTLWMVAHVPFDRGSHFAPRHTVELDAPIAPGSALKGFVFLEAADLAWTETLAEALPMHPSFLLAVGLDERELTVGVVAESGGRDAIVRGAAEALKGRTIPSRTRSFV